MKHTILVVDDDDGIRESLCELFEDLGYDVLAAENGQRALDILRESPLPCLVFLDMMMPVMDGAQFLAAVDDYSPLKPVPIIVVTAGNLPDLPQVRHVLRKPMATETLRNLVHQYCPQ